ncbi:MAG: 2-oxo acid dehydrogenase subunit E2 [Chloroflexi bacterium]|nr:2-oxo acid dehydrogenase subunit E2 [Chloroflexota bacterium]
MTYPIQLPHVGESVTEAIIGKWLVGVGDHVDKFDPMVEVVTDKVNMEFPAPESGTIISISAVEGDSVPMGSSIGEMDPDNPNAVPVAGTSGMAGSSSSGSVAPGLVGEMITGANVGPTGGTFADTSMETQTASDASAQDDAGEGRNRSDYYSPVVMRLASQNGVDLSAITGTGAGGRVTRSDVQAAIEGSGMQVEAQPELSAASTDDSLVEPTPIRKIIAANMVRSWTQIPHAWTSVEVDVTGLVKLRDSQKEYFRSRNGVSLSYVAFSLSALAAALRKNPLANSAWIDGKIRMNGRVNIGVAVASDDGLVVPVVHDADQLSVAGLAGVAAPLIEKARKGNLTIDQVQGGTFTLNNTGPLGSVWGGSIISPPQVAIVNTEAIVKRPIVVESDTGDSIAIRQMMNLSLSFDHRVLDGAEAATFIQDVKAGLEAFGPGSDIG